jgi:hypothetical protein
MLIQINTDRNIEGSTELIAHFSSLLKEQLGRFEEHITRLEVHLSDENAQREAGNDKKCVLEAKIKGKDPVVITTLEDTIHKSVKIAAEKMFLTLDKSIQKQRAQG